MTRGSASATAPSARRHNPSSPAAVSTGSSASQLRHWDLHPWERRAKETAMNKARTEKYSLKWFNYRGGCISSKGSSLSCCTSSSCSFLRKLRKWVEAKQLVSGELVRNLLMRSSIGKFNYPNQKLSPSQEWSITGKNVMRTAEQYSQVHEWTSTQERTPKPRTAVSCCPGEVLELQETLVYSLSSLPQGSPGLLPILGDSCASLLPGGFCLSAPVSPSTCQQRLWSHTFQVATLATRLGCSTPQKFFP